MGLGRRLGRPDSYLVRSSSWRRLLILKVLRGRVVARVDRVRQARLFVMGPELAQAWLGVDDRVHQLAVLALAAADEDVADDVAVPVELNRPARGVRDRDLVQGLRQGFAVVAFVAELLQGSFHALTGDIHSR